MLDTVFEEFRKASESSMQMQQDMLRQLGQQWLSASPGTTGTSSEWRRTVQKRWVDFALETLRKQREAVDSIYESNIQLVEQSARASEAKSTQELGQMVEEFWRKSLETLKSQSEAQFRDFQALVEKSFEMARPSNGQGAPNANAGPRM
jgi:hypothetical protein